MDRFIQVIKPRLDSNQYNQAIMAVFNHLIFQMVHRILFQNLEDRLEEHRQTN